MKTITKRISVLLLVICMIASMVLPAAALTVSDIPTTEIITTASGYTSAADVTYPDSGYIANWGARGELATFISAKASDYYTSGNTYKELIQYNGGTGTAVSGSDLYTALNALAVAQQHTITTYDGLKDLYGYTDCVLGDTTQLSLFYMGTMVSSTWDSGVTYNREHTWPKSKLTNEESDDGADIMHIRPADPGVNSSRSNTAYGESDGYVDPGVSVRGDVARMILYMYVRWGNESNLWGSSGAFESLDVLLSWMAADPVDTWEMGRNDAIQSITGARNMFVDYPELGYKLFSQDVPADLVTPSTASTDSGETDTTTYTATLVTSMADLSIGDQIIIVAGDYAYAMGAQNGYYRDPVAITKSEDKSTVTFDSTVQTVTLGDGAVGGTYALNVGDGYLYASSSDYNNLQTETALSTNSSWKIAITDGVATIQAVGANTRNTMMYNTSTDYLRFTCYATGTTGLGTVSVYAVADENATTCTHSFTSEAVAASCTVQGYTKYTCSTCGNFYYDSYTDIIDHTYVDGACSVCGEAEPAANTWTEVDISAITSTDIIAITMTAADGTTYALYNGNGASTAPTAVVVTVNGNVMTSEDIDTLAWNIASETDGLIIYVNGSTESWLYSTTSNNGIRVGTGENKYWTVEATYGYLQNVALSRYMGVYNAQNWRSYTSMHTNISGQTLSFWKLNVTTGDTETCEHAYESVVTAPTCTEGGYTTNTCTLCGNITVSDEVDALGHSNESVVTAPTCTEQGYTTYTCTVCSSSYTSDYTAPAGHTYTNGICSVCGEAEVTIDLSGTYYIAAIRSAGGNYFYVAGAMNGTRYNAVDSGLTALPSAITSPEDNMSFVFEKNEDGTYCIKVDGTESYLGWTSGNTGDLVAKDSALNVSITASGDTYLIYFTADDGVRYLSLNDSTYNYVAWYKSGQAKDLYLIPVVPCDHSYTSSVTAPTCTEDGETVYTCSLCGDSYSEPIDATGHTYVDGVCSACGESEPVSGEVEEGYYLITDLADITDGQYIVVANGTTNALGTTLASKISATTVTVADGYIAVADGLPVWTIEAVSGGYAMSVNGTYVTYSSSTNLGSSTTAYAWVVTESDGVFTFTASTSSTRAIYYQISGNRFGGYSTSNATNTAYVSTLQLYKYTEASSGTEHICEYEAVVTAPTCTEDGYTTYTCSVCGDSYVADEVAALGHTWVDADCDTAKTCSVCGATEGEAAG
ncbi:MAG: endonuclease, partial [Oscillospiraceae bacterium]|nr:endonuclease [Oscillospiraceae bacterium]